MSVPISSTTPNNAVAFINGHIYTVNPTQPWAEAFIVSPTGTFTHIGSTSTILDLAQKQSLVTIDLKSRFVMPGIHDAHAHILYSGMAATSHIRLSPELTTATAIDELTRGKCMCRYTHVNADWIVAHGYEVQDFRRQELDEAFPDTPVVIRAGAGHNAYVNSEALRRAGYDLDAEPDAQGTTYVRDAEGSLTGELHENALGKVMIALAKPGLAHVKRAVGVAVRMLHRAGVTGVQEASASTSLLSALREMDSQGDGLKLDVYTHTVYAPDWIGEESEASLHATIDAAADYASRHVHTRFVKIILDGTPLPPRYTHAGMLEDGSCDESKLLTRNVFEAVRKYDARGMTMKVHCTGKGATRLTLDAYAAARRENPGGPRHEVAHCNGVHDEDYPRFKELNVTAEMSPAFFFRHPVTEASGGLMDWNFVKMRKADAHMTIGSDWGAGAEPDILPCLSGIVDDAGGAGNVIRLLTLAGAEAVGREKEVGSIEIGKTANFVVVSQDLSKGEFDGAKILETWFEGECVFESED